jgi:hypothetical protein
MQKSSTLYLLFALLGMGVAVVLVLLFRFISPENRTYRTVTESQAPADLEALLYKAGDRDSWIYRMQLHRKQNIFSYPRTVYHINLN